MRYADANVIKIKHAVLEEVARLAFAGELEERKDEIPMKLIPGPTAQFRCCIYKEREIIRQRVRLAEGKAPGIEDDGNVIQVISSACEDCPISSYTVTENCQNCIGKACINACKFGAIEAGRRRSHIDPSKCKECGKCAEACPYNAIAEMYPLRKMYPQLSVRCDRIQDMDRGCDQSDQLRKACLCDAGSGYRGTVRTGYHDGKLEKGDERAWLH